MPILLNKEINIDDAADLIIEKLNAGGEVSFTPKGTSMKPLLSGNEKVTVKKQQGKLKKYDLPFYKRQGTSQYIIHRVVGFDKSGGYVICGDNMLLCEYGITDSDVLGVVTGFCRNGKYHSVNDISYKLYCRYICAIRPIRRMYHRIKRKFSK